MVFLLWYNGVMETLLKNLNNIKDLLEDLVKVQPPKPKISMQGAVDATSAPSAIKPMATQKVAADPNSKKKAKNVARQLDAATAVTAKPIAEAMSEGGNQKAPMTASIKETLNTTPKAKLPKPPKLPKI